MFYDDADFYNAYDPLEDFSEEAFSNVNLDVIVLQDKETEPAKMWYIDENHDTVLLEELGEINMGDRQTLQDFIEYSKNHYPADRYILSFYNHGLGWLGVCLDDTSDDHLTMDEVQMALTNAGGVDFVCFTAPCCMGAMECVYELRNCVNIYIGSEEGSGYGHWFGTIENMCNELKDNPDISNNEFGEIIIQSIWDNTHWQKSITMSAIRTDKIEELVTSIDILCTHWLDSNDPLKNIKTAQARRKAKEIKYNLHQYVDFLDFIKKYNGIENDQTISQHIQNITEVFNEAVIKECHGVNHTGDHGLSIFFPLSKLILRSIKNSIYDSPDYGLDFTRDTHWDELLYAQSRIIQSKTKTFDHHLPPQFLENHPRMFPMLRHLLGL